MAAGHRVTISTVAVAAAAHPRGVMARETTESVRDIETETGSAIAIAVVTVTVIGSVIVIGSEVVETVTVGGNASGLENETVISGHLAAAMVGWKTRFCGVSERLQWALVAARKPGLAGAWGKSKPWLERIRNAVLCGACFTKHLQHIAVAVHTGVTLKDGAKQCFSCEP